MIKYKIDAPVYIGRLEQHNRIKDTLLKQISDQREFTNSYDPDDNVDISRCDWETSRWDNDRLWVKTLLDFLHPHLEKSVNDLGYEDFKILEMWFQQYESSSGHGWHVHGNNWTNVYYLDMPEDTPKTQFLNPYDQRTICEFDVKEGDVLTFPSYVIHRAPINTSNKTKTIISWNMDTMIKRGLEV